MTRQSDFWSRRRAKVAEEAEIEAQAARAQAAQAEVARLEEREDGEILAELGLKDPDEMQAGDDFSVFLKHALPDRIRRRALRRLWGLNPILANVDGLLDYGEDFTDAATVLETLSTTYQVGKGMMKHIEHLAAAAAAKEGETGEPVLEPEAHPEEDESLHAALEAEPEPRPDTEPLAAQDPPEQPEEAYEAPRPRRMVFRIETASHEDVATA